MPTWRLQRRKVQRLSVSTVMDLDLYSAFTRLSLEDFDFLLSLVKSHITGFSCYRPAIPPDVKLVVTLRFLAKDKQTDTTQFLLERLTLQHASCCLSAVAELLVKRTMLYTRPALSTDQVENGRGVVTEWILLLFCPFNLLNSFSSQL